MLNFRWPEMRPVALELIGRVREGHARRNFSIPVVDFVGVFAPHSPESELAKVSARGSIHFKSDSEGGGTFQLAEGERAVFDLQREGLYLRIPRKMSGRYEILPDAFRINFNDGEELEGCRRLLLLICNRVETIEVSGSRVDVRFGTHLFDLCVEFE